MEIETRLGRNARPQNYAQRLQREFEVAVENLQREVEQLRRNGRDYGETELLWQRVNVRGMCKIALRATKRLAKERRKASFG